MYKSTSSLIMASKLGLAQSVHGDIKCHAPAQMGSGGKGYHPINSLKKLTRLRPYDDYIEKQVHLHLSTPFPNLQVLT